MKSQKHMSNNLKATTLKNHKIIGIRSRKRGHAYERKIVNELRQITGDEDLCTSRKESKRLDDMKIDVADPNNTLSFYCQIKSTQQTPQIKKINNEVGKKDKPLVIFWNAQEARDAKQISVGEYCILPKKFFYELIKNNETSKNRS